MALGSLWGDGASRPAFPLQAVLLARDRPFCVLRRSNSLERAAPLRDGKQVAAPAGPAATSLTLPLRSKTAFSDGRVRATAPAGSALSWGTGLGALWGAQRCPALKGPFLPRMPPWGAAAAPWWMSTK